MAKRNPKVLYRYMKAKHALSMIKDPWLKITPPSHFNDVFELTPRASKKSNPPLAKLILENQGSREQAANVFNQCFNLDWKEAELQGFAENNPRVWQALMAAYVWSINTAFAMD